MTRAAGAIHGYRPALTFIRSDSDSDIVSHIGTGNIRINTIMQEFAFRFVKTVPWSPFPRVSLPLRLGAPLTLFVAAVFIRTIANQMPIVHPFTALHAVKVLYRLNHAAR